MTRTSLRRPTLSRAADRTGRPGRRVADRGSGPVTALMVMGILALIFTIGITALFAAAGDERSAAQHAADAAALAGADGVLDGAPLALVPGFTVPSEIPVLLGGAGCGVAGQVDAFRLAQANGATLTSYCYDAFTDTARVTVRMNDSQVADTRATAAAEASTTFEPAGCRFPVDYVPGPTALTTTVTCGDADYDVVFDPALDRFHFVRLALELRDLDPRLTA